MSLTIIVACSAAGRVIGSEGQLPWRQRADMKRFKERTTDAIVIMGSKTYASIGKLLPNRHNIIISRQEPEAFMPPIEGTSDFCITSEIDKVLDQAKEGDEEVFVIGGGEIYKHAMPHADVIEVTEVFCDVVGDTVFPEIDPSQWVEITRTFHSKDDNNQYDYSFVTYAKR